MQSIHRRASWYVVGCVALLVTVQTAQAAPNASKCDQPESLSMNDMVNCEMERQHAAEKHMAQALKGALKCVEGFPSGGRHLKSAQRYWSRYIQEQCAAIGATYDGGTSGPLNVHGCLADLTEARAKELEETAGYCHV